MDANTIIDKLGGTSAVAKMCGLKPPAISCWRQRGIPKGWAAYLVPMIRDLRRNGKLKAASK